MVYSASQESLGRFYLNRKAVEWVSKLLGAYYGGTLLFGSTVEKRFNRPPADTDIIGLSLTNYFTTGRTKVEDLILEHFVRPIDRLCMAVVAHQDFFDTRNVAAGLLIDWPKNIDLFPKLKRIAEVNWPRGPLRPGPSSHLFMRLKYQNMGDERRTRATDDVTRAFLQAWTLDHCIADFYRFYGLYLSKWSYLMGYLKIRDPKMHGMVEGFLLSRDLDDRERRLRKIVEHHLAPFGGYPPKEWVVRTGGEYVRERDETTGEWLNWTAPSLDEIQPMADAYKIGINPEVACGQEFDFSGSIRHALGKRIIKARTRTFFPTSVRSRNIFRARECTCDGSPCNY